MAGDVSRLRQRLVQTDQARTRKLEALLKLRQLIRGTVGVRARVCGHPGCRCARGELHESMYLSAQIHGRARQVHIPARDERFVHEGADRYRQWRAMRAEVAALDLEIKEILDALGDLLLVPYPPDNPIPPPGKRGRKANKGSST